MIKSIKIILLSCLVSWTFSSRAQADLLDTTRLNTVRLNITPLLVLGPSNVTVGYERVLKSHQTISANIGLLRFPNLIKTKAGAPIEWVNSNKNVGFMVSADYRFYFNRNRYNAPDGLYWGPYVAHYNSNTESTLNLSEDGAFQGTADLNSRINILNVGLQLGYQFVFWDRLALDLILAGPGIGFYDAKLNLISDVNLNGNEEYIKGVYDALVALYPALESVIDNAQIDANGATSFRSIGYRFVVHLGYRF